MARIITVSNSTQLNAAISNLRAGDTVLLESGTYSGLNRIKNKDFTAEKVVFKSADSDNPAIIRGLHLDSTKNVEIDGLHFVRTPTGTITNAFQTLLRMDNSHDITVKNSIFKGALINDGSVYNNVFAGSGLFTSGTSRNIIIENNDFSNLQKAITLSALVDSVVRDNFVHDYREDGLYLGGARNVLIENNTVIKNGRQGSGDHPDMMQINGQMVNLTIKGNFLSSGTADFTQGLFMGSGTATGSTGITVVDNIIIATGQNALYAQDFANLVIRRNMILESSVNHSHIPSILLRGSNTRDAIVEDNIAHRILTWDGSSAIASNNLLVQRDNPNAANHYSKVFVGDVVARTADLTLEDFLVKPEIIAQYEGSLGANLQAFNQFDLSFLGDGNEPTQPNEPVVPQPETPVIGQPTLPTVPPTAETPISPPSETPTAPTTDVSIPSIPTEPEILWVEFSGTIVNDIISGTTGRDMIRGLAGHDYIEGRTGHDQLMGGRNNDTLGGGQGADILRGAKDTDLLRGGRGNDTIFGGEGADTLIGALGDDVLTGGVGADVFRFNGAIGNDVITDFTSGEDQLHLVSFSGINAAQDVLDRTQYGNGQAVIRFDEANSITLNGITTPLTTADIVFG